MLQTKSKIDYNYSYNQTTYKKKNKARKAKSGFRFMVIYSLIIIFIGLPLVAYIGQSVQITHLDYQISQLKDDLKDIEDSNHQLNLQLARDRSLAKIDKIAREKLHMIEPREMEVIVLNDDQKEPESDDANSKTENKFFLASLFDNLLERLGTVKAGSLD